jgi:hypothetical protein
MVAILADVAAKTAQRGAATSFFDEENFGMVQSRVTPLSSFRQSFSRNPDRRSSRITVWLDSG